MTISYVSEGTLATGFGGAASPVSVSYPASTTSGNLLLMLITCGDSTDGTVTTPSGWTAPSGNTISGGAGAFGGDSGPRRSTVFTKISDGTEGGGSVSVTWPAGGGALFGGQIHQYSKTTGTWDIVVGSGTDTTADSSFIIITTGNLDLASGDMLVGLGSGNTNSALNSPVLTASGLTIASATEDEASTLNGGSRGFIEICHAGITAGSGTTAVTLTISAPADPLTGSGLVIRLREASSGPTYTLTASGGTYSYAGTDAGLLFNRTLSASGGAYAYTGGDAALIAGHVLGASSGTYSYIGGDATLIYTPVSSYTLTADAGTYAYAGAAANLTYGRVFPCETGVYSYSGAETVLRYSGDESNSGGGGGGRRAKYRLVPKLPTIKRKLPDFVNEEVGETETPSVQIGDEYGSELNRSILAITSDIQDLSGKLKAQEEELKRRLEEDIEDVLNYL